MGGRGYANRDAVRCALVLELRTLRRQRRASSELKGEGAGSALTCMEITDLSQYYHRLSVNAPKCPKCYIISLAGVTAQIVRCIVVSASTQHVIVLSSKSLLLRSWRQTFTLEGLNDPSVHVTFYTFSYLLRGSHTSSAFQDKFLVRVLP